MCNIFYMNNKSIEVDFSESIAAMGQSSIVAKLLELQVQFKIFHWQTYSFSQHEAFGELYDSLSGLVDSFVETYQGIYGRLDFANTQMSFANLGQTDFQTMLQQHAASLTTWERYFNNTDLLNIRDEILASLNKTNYLLTLV